MLYDVRDECFAFKQQIIRTVYKSSRLQLKVTLSEVSANNIMG